MKKIWIGIGIAVILALLSGCGGGGGGPGVTPPQAGDVARLFPLTQGQTLTYDGSETQHAYMKITGAFTLGLAKRKLQAGPLSLDIPLPKFSPLKRAETHTYESIRDETNTGTDINTIIGTHTGDPFPANITAAIEETHGQGNWNSHEVEKMDGSVVSDQTYSGNWEDWTRDFYTNENGEVKMWGWQEKVNSDWGPIQAYPEPWLLFKAGETSWKVAHIEEDVENAVFSADLMANLVAKETITVPAGTFTCYKVVYKYTNVKLETPPQNVQVTSWNLSSTITVWLALDKGIVKSENKTTLTASFKDLESGRTGSISMSSTSTSSLKQ